MANPTPPSPTPVAPNLYQQPPVLTQIQQKVRRLTRSPSTSQLTDTELNNYINTFIVYDFPETLRTFNLLRQFSFYTNPGQGVYNTDIASFAGATNNRLYNFQNLYLTIHPPVYIAGFQAFYSQSREQFTGIYPKVSNIVATGQVGNNTPGPFVGQINTQNALVLPPTPNMIGSILVHESLVFTCINALTGIGLSLVDIPVVDPATGCKTIVGNLYDPNSAAYQAALINPPIIGAPAPNGTINYVTGVYTLTFSNNTLTGWPITSQYLLTSIGLPQAMLFYNNQFTLRPIPNQVYRVDFEVYQRPTALLEAGQAPELEEYWQFIALGASIKVLQDRMDMETIQMIAPEFKQQERLCLRRTLVQYSNERTASIYTEQVSNQNGFNGLYGGGSF